MKSNFKIYLLTFVIGGLFFALIYWAQDNVDGRTFDTGRFAVRFLIYGAGMTLAWYLANRFFGKPITKKE